jgi:hypothetical protein
MPDVGSGVFGGGFGFVCGLMCILISGEVTVPSSLMVWL